MSEPSEADPSPEDPGDGETETEDAPARPRPRKKRKKARKKKKKVEAADDGAEDDGAEEDGASSESAVETPLPGEGTADGDRLRQAHRSFDVGDYRAVRVQVRVLEDSEDPAVAAAARALRQRVDVDPIQVVVLTSCAAVVAAIIYVWIL